MAHIHPGDLLEGAVRQQTPQQLTFAASQVHHSTRAQFPQLGRHQIQTLRVKRHGPLEILLAMRGLFRPDFHRIHRGALFVQQSRHRPIHQRRAPLQIAADNQLALRMLCQPTLAVTQQFLHLGIADEVMLLIVQHRKQNI